MDGVRCRLKPEKRSRPPRTPKTPGEPMDAPGSKRSAQNSGKTWVTEFGPYLTIGMQLAIAVVGFFFLGRWLDDIFGTAPWLMIVGLMVGTAGGFISFFRSVISMVKKEDEQEQKSSESVGREDR